MLPLLNSCSGLVSGTDRYFVTALQTAHLEHDVDLLYTAGYIPVIEGDPVVVRKSRAVPVLLDARFNNLVE